MAAPKGNKFALGNKGGRPPKYKTVKELERQITEYFESCVPEYDEVGNLIRMNYPSVTGLALFLGFADRQSLKDYRAKEEFSFIIRRAIAAVEHHYEQRLNQGSATGAIFALKNMGWKDKVEQELSTVEGSQLITSIEIKKA